MMRIAPAVLVTFMMVVLAAHAWGTETITLAERAAAIERAAQAPDGERVVLGHISRKLRMSSDTLRQQRARTGLGWGDLLIANLLSTATGRTFDDVVAEFRNGKGWEATARDYHVDPARLANDVQHSQDIVEHQAEDRAPASEHLTSPSEHSSHGNAPNTGHGHGH